MNKVIAAAVALATLVLACTRTASAQQAPAQPSQGVAHREDRPSAMQFECDPATSGSMRCRFTELHVWKPLREIATTDEQRRTCTLAAHNFTQTFRRDGTADAPSWITTTGPYGVCGITRVSRFIGSRQTDGSIYWTYVAQLKVAHRSVEDGPTRCSDLRELNEEYGWQWREQRADCATIRFETACSSSDGLPCLGDGPIVVH